MASPIATAVATAGTAQGAGRHGAVNDSMFGLRPVAPVEQAILRRFEATRAGQGESVARLLDRARAALDEHPGVARECLSRAIALLGAGQPESRLRAQARAVHAPRSGLARWQMNRIDSYVDAHIGSTIRASDLAALVRLSASHFFHAFKDSFGETPLAYVARRRMALAQQMMLSGNESLAQIALACGLCDQSHFTRVFRRVVGTSPHAWRREHDRGPDAVCAAHDRRQASEDEAPGEPLQATGADHWDNCWDNCNDGRNGRRSA